MRSSCRSRTILSAVLLCTLSLACKGGSNGGDTTRASTTPDGSPAAPPVASVRAAAPAVPPAEKAAVDDVDAAPVTPGPDFAVAADPLHGYVAADNVSTEAFLSRRSPGCLACARQALCLDEARCEDAQGNAAQGAGAGRSRIALCRELLACAQATRCATGGLERAQPCFCGKHNATACMETKADGPCKPLEMAALETTDPRVIAATYINPRTGGGRANDVLECIALNCAMCF